MKEMFSAWNEHKKDKKQSNLEFSTNKLKEENIHFTSHNSGYHLVVEDVFDFWPTTGKFINRETGASGRGVSNIINILREEEQK